MYARQWLGTLVEEMLSSPIYCDYCKLYAVRTVPTPQQALHSCILNVLGECIIP